VTFRCSGDVVVGLSNVNSGWGFENNDFSFHTVTRSTVVNANNYAHQGNIEIFESGKRIAPRTPTSAGSSGSTPNSPEPVAYEAGRYQTRDPVTGADCAPEKVFSSPTKLLAPGDACMKIYASTGGSWCIAGYFGAQNARPCTTPEDQYRIEVVGNTVTYSKSHPDVNSGIPIVFHTSTKAPTFPLRVNAALFSALSEVTDVTIY
jgi:hypothetical protein